jgi:hypothetical protein
MLLELDLAHLKQKEFKITANESYVMTPGCG